MTLTERRSATRVSVNVPVRFRAITDAPDREHTGEAENVSAGGVYFTTDLPLSKGTPLRLSLKMPEAVTGKPAAEWSCLGRVVHVQPQPGRMGVGVQFTQHNVLPPGTN